MDFKDSDSSVDLSGEEWDSITVVKRLLENNAEVGCWNYSSVDRKLCPAGQRGNYGQPKLSFQQAFFRRQIAYGWWLLEP